MKEAEKVASSASFFWRHCRRCSPTRKYSCLCRMPGSSPYISQFPRNHPLNQLLQNLGMIQRKRIITHSNRLRQGTLQLAADWNDEATAP